MCPTYQRDYYHVMDIAVLTDYSSRIKFRLVNAEHINVIVITLVCWALIDRDFS